MKGNFGFTSELLEKLKVHGNTCPVMLSSSIQAELDNSYGKSKKAGEELLKKYQKKQEHLYIFIVSQTYTVSGHNQIIIQW